MGVIFAVVEPRKLGLYSSSAIEDQREDVILLSIH